MKLKGLICFITVILFSCKSDNTTVYKNLKALHDQKDCQGNCGIVMACEGKTITIDMKTGDASGEKLMLFTANAIFARDPGVFDYSLQIYTNEALTTELYAELSDDKPETIRCTGKLEGWDQSNSNSGTCFRSYKITVNSLADIKIIK